MTRTRKLSAPVLLLVALLLILVSTTAAAQNDDDVFSDPLRSGGTGPDMIVIPQGSFILGGGRPAPGDIGKVSIDSIAVSVTEITRGQYLNFLKASKSGELRRFDTANPDLPMSRVSFDEAEAYLTWLSHESGHSYRLPSASEWEYAARAGGTRTYSWGEELGEGNANCLNCKSEFSGALAPVGSFASNDWGLYDMHGNVWEWTKDCVDSNSAPPPNGLPQLFGNCDSRELRGGSAESDGWSIRANARAFGVRQMKESDVGFRVVMDLAD